MSKVKLSVTSYVQGKKNNNTFLIITRRRQQAATGGDAHLLGCQVDLVGENPPILQPAASLLTLIISALFLFTST